MSYERFIPKRRITHRSMDEFYNLPDFSNSDLDNPRLEKIPNDLPLDFSKRKLTQLENQFESMRPTFDLNATQIGAGELPQVAPPARPNILDEYGRIIGAHPERDRLRQLMEASPTREQFQPNKMDRFSAILGGVAAGFRNPAEGMQVAQDALDRPFNQAQEEYEKKLRNVSALAGMESGDIQERLGGLKFSRDEERDTRDFDFDVKKFEAQQKHNADALRSQGWDVRPDPKTGRLIGVHPELGTKDLGPFGQTLDEAAAQKKVEDEREQANRIKQIEATGAQNKAVAQIGATSRENISKSKILEQSAKLKAAAANSPDKQVSATLNSLEAFATDNEIDLSDYVGKDEAGRPMVKEKGYFSSPDGITEAKIRAEIRRIIVEGLSKPPENIATPSLSHAPTSTPIAEVPSGWTKVPKKGGGG